MSSVPFWCEIVIGIHVHLLLMHLHILWSFIATL